MIFQPSVNQAKKLNLRNILDSHDLIFQPIIWYMVPINSKILVYFHIMNLNLDTRLFDYLISRIFTTVHNLSGRIFTSTSS